MKIVLIAALSRSGAIGYRGRLLYHLPEDMAHFRRVTMGHTVIMGSRTYRSLPAGPLAGRRNIVLSRRGSMRAPAVLPPDTRWAVYPSLRQALADCAAEVVYVIGGAQVYAEAMSLAHELILTHVDDEPAQADAWFPPMDGWHETGRTEYPATPLRPYAFAIVTYRR